jgi:hypothetical protein
VAESPSTTPTLRSEIRSCLPSLPGAHTLVDSISLDEYCEAIGVRDVNLLKINAEGADLDVLSGMQSLLRRSVDPWVIVEFCPMYLEAAGYPPSRLIDLLFELGFQVYAIVRMELSHHWRTTEVSIDSSLP